MLLKQIHHRVKDNFQIISSIMSLEQSMIENKELIDEIGDNHEESALEIPLLKTAFDIKAHEDNRRNQASGLNNPRWSEVLGHVKQWNQNQRFGQYVQTEP